jgi:hypothetical protein
MSASTVAISRARPPVCSTHAGAEQPGLQGVSRDTSVHGVAPAGCCGIEKGDISEVHRT